MYKKNIDNVMLLGITGQNCQKTQEQGRGILVPSFIKSQNALLPFQDS